MINDLTPSRIVVSRNLSDFLENYMDYGNNFLNLINRFCECDFGDLGEEDTLYQKSILENDNKNLERMMGVYELEGKKIWLMLDYYSEEETVLTGLFPEDY